MGLFDSWTFDLKTLGLGGQISRDYKPAHMQAPTPLHEPTIKALYSYAKAIELGLAVGKGSDSYGNEFTVVESRREEYTVMVVLCERRVSAAIWDGAEANPYQLAKSRRDGTEIIVALIPELLGNEEFRVNFDLFKTMCESTKLEDIKDYIAGDESVRKSLFVLCGMIYWAVESEKRVVIGPRINKISPDAIKECAYMPTESIVGAFKGATSTATTASTTDLNDCVLDAERVFSEQEKTLIPQLPDWYIVPDYLVSACRMAASKKLSRPVRNLMLRGEAGTGKTEAAKAMAAVMHLPYVSLCCHPDMTINDFTGTILPKLSDGQKSDGAFQMENYPTFMDISMDPCYAYEKLTGEEAPDDVTEEAVLSLALQKAAETQAGNSSIQYEYCDSPLVQAIKNGWLCEIQEPAIIERPGVLTGLNSLLDTCQQVTLPTGEVIKRHPDCVIVVTTNTNYQGCKEINSSVISRMQFVKDTQLPTDAELKERITKITGFNVDTILSGMIRVVNQINTFCKERMIEDGVCGVRELIDWVQGYLVLGNVVEAAMLTVISKASADPESQHEIKISCLDPTFC